MNPLWWRSVRLLRPSPATLPATSRLAMSTAAPIDQGLAFAGTPDLSKEELWRFPAFRIWLSTLQRSLEQQRNPSHEFSRDPYVLRRIDVQAVDFFGGGRLGFVKLKAGVSNASGESLPGSVFLRGGSVGMLVSAGQGFCFGQEPLYH